MRHVALLVAAATWLAALAGCGGTGASTSTHAAETRFARLESSLCMNNRALSRAQDPKTVAAIRSLAKSDHGLPRVARWISDLQARSRLLASLRSDAEGFGAHHRIAALLEATRRIGLKVYEDGKAIGLKCIRPPRKPIRG